MYKNICLIGLPSSGKSYLGNKLYKDLGKGFIDTDILIKTKYKKSLESIISEIGNDNFLNLENKIINYLNCKNTLISTGGSVIYRQNSINYLKNNLNCEIIHLNLSFNEFEKRINNLTDYPKQRGIIIKNNETLKDLYNNRINLYKEYSDYEIDINNIDYSDLLDYFNNLNNKNI